MAAESVYLYNVEYGAFLTGGNYWGTRACVVYNGQTGLGNNVSFKDFCQGGANINGYKWKVNESEETLEDGGVCYNFANKTTSNYLTADGWDGVWVDGGDARPFDLWIITSLENNTFELTYHNMNGKFGLSEYAWGATGNTNTFFLDATKTYDAEVEGETVTNPVFSGTAYTTWAFVSEEEYERVQPLLNAYYHAIGLKQKIDETKVAYPTLDLSEAEAVYANTASTDEEVSAALAAIDDAIDAYKASLATFDEPMDLTSRIGDGSDVSPWTREFTGTGQVGTWHTNTWSTEADNGGDGTDMTTPFCEDWVANGSILSDQKIYQVLTGAAPGLYKFTADVRLYNEAGNVDALTGATMYFGDETVTLEEQVEMYKSGSKCVLWSKNYFNIIAIVPESGDIEFGFNIKNATFNWMAFKKTSLFYYGNEDVEANAVKLFKQSYSFEKAGDDTEANAGVIAAYNEAVDAFEAAATKAEIEETAKVAAAAQAELDANIAAYVTFDAKKTAWEEELGVNANLEGEEWDAFSDFVNNMDVPEGYPSPTPQEVKDEKPFTTAEIEAYIKLVDSLCTHAIATSLVPGADCTNMLTNAAFTNGFTGWTSKTGNVGNFAGLEPAIPNNVEVYENVIDCYQVVKDVPDGIYSLSCKAFERPAANGNYTGTEESKVFLYMNDFQTPVQNIVKDALSAEQDEEGKYLYAKDGVNCYLTQSYSSGAGNTLLDYNVEGHGFVPNGMVGAAVAFKAGRYTQTVYGLVEGGEMKIGLTSNGVTAHWVLWADFRLTYEGKNAEAIAAILPNYIEQLEEYIDANELTTPVSDAASEVLDVAKDLTEDDGTDALWEALVKVNEALVAAKANVAALEAYNNANEKLEAALNGDTPNPAGEEAYAEIQDQVEGYLDLTTEELNELIAKMEEVTDALNEPIYNEASDDNPVDCTAKIKNADIEEGADVAWLYTKNGGNGPKLDSGISGKSVEFWNGTASNLKFNIYQVISELPAGTYELTADAANSFNGEATDAEAYAENPDAYGAAFLYASVKVEEDSTLNATPVVPQEAGCTESYENYSVIFTVPEGGADVTVGFQSAGVMAARWFACDNFMLTYYGTESEKAESGKESFDVATDIRTITAAAAPSAIYSISGARLNGLQKGLNIVKFSNGTVKKVFVK